MAHALVTRLARADGARLPRLSPFQNGERHDNQHGRENDVHHSVTSPLPYDARRALIVAACGTGRRRQLTAVVPAAPRSARSDVFDHPLLNPGREVIPELGTLLGHHFLKKLSLLPPGDRLV